MKSAVCARRVLSLHWFVVVGIGVALLLAFMVSPHASSKPDGLEKVAADHQLDTAIRPHALANGPLAEYRMEGIDDTGLATGTAGIIGVGVTFVVGLGLAHGLRLAARRRAATAGATESQHG